MKKIRKLIITITIMCIVSIVSLLIVSALTYIYKWYADKALIGITVTYILTGFVGGLTQKLQNKEEKNIGQKMLEAIFLSVLFMMILVVISVLGAQISFEISARFLMIFMLLVGSVCLGRIL